MIQREKDITLKPFVSDSTLSGLGLSVRVELSQFRLELCYALRGPSGSVVLPSQGAEQAGPRMDRLWEHTCFEAFFSLPHVLNYWELNLAPSGAWNLYRFDGYRQGMAEEDSIADIAIASRSSASGGWDLNVNLDLERIPIFKEHFRYSRQLEMGLAAVLKHGEGRHSYWAAAHAGEKPDFHLRKSMIVKLG